MSLSTDLVYQFVKITDDADTSSSASIAYGTVVEYGGTFYVRLDGSDLLTPVETTVELSAGERVMVTIENHTATATGNVTNPSASAQTVDALKEAVDENLNTITLLSNTVNMQGNTITELNNTVNMQANDITEMRNEMMILDNEIDLQSNTISEMNDTVTSINNTITQINNTVEQQNNTIYEINDTITSIGNEVDSQNNVITQIGNTIIQQNSSISEINSTIAIYNSSFQIVNGVITGIKGVDTEWITTDELEATMAKINSLDVDSLLANYAKITDLEAVDAKIGDLQAFSTVTELLKATYASLEYLEANYISVAYLEANYITAEYIESEFIRTDLGNFTVEMIGTLLANAGVVTDMTIENGYVTGELNSVTINADLITTGTLSVERLLITGEDGLIYQINLESSGLTATELTDDIYQNYINGTVIIAKSITAEQIAAGTITATEIAANTITAEQIAAGTITSTEIEAGTITAANINMANLVGDNAFIDAISTNSVVVGAQATAQQALELYDAVGNTINEWSYIDPNTNITYINGGNIATGTIVALGNVTAGSFNLGNGNFVVDSAGNLVAQNATIYGAIYADYGEIGGWIIGEEDLYSSSGSYNKLYLSSSDSTIYSIGRSSKTTISNGEIIVGYSDNDDNSFVNIQSGGVGIHRWEEDGWRQYASCDFYDFNSSYDVLKASFGLGELHSDYNDLDYEVMRIEFYDDYMGLSIGKVNSSAFFSVTEEFAYISCNTASIGLEDSISIYGKNGVYLGSSTYIQKSAYISSNKTSQYGCDGCFIGTNGRLSLTGNYSNSTDPGITIEYDNTGSWNAILICYSSYMQVAYSTSGGSASNYIRLYSDNTRIRRTCYFGNNKSDIYSADGVVVNTNGYLVCVRTDSATNGLYIAYGAGNTYNTNISCASTYLNITYRSDQSGSLNYIRIYDDYIRIPQDVPIRGDANNDLVCLNSSGNVVLGNGSTNTGDTVICANNGGTIRMRLYGSGGYAAIYPSTSLSTSNTGKIFVVSTTTSYSASTDTNTNIALAVGTNTTGPYIRSYACYSYTNSNSANMYVTTAGTFTRSTASSARYKNHINYFTNEENASQDGLNKIDKSIAYDDFRNDMRSILNIPVVQFHYNNGYVNGEPDFNYSKYITGFIAEDVYKNCPEATEFNEDGTIEMWSEKQMIPRMVFVLQEHDNDIDILKKKVSALADENTMLRQEIEDLKSLLS